MTTIGSFCKCAVPDNVFCESSLPRSPEEKQLRAKRTFEEMMSYIPGMQPLRPPTQSSVHVPRAVQNMSEHTDM